MVLVNTAECNANALVVCASLPLSDATLMKPHLQALRVEQQPVCQLLALLIFLLCFSHDCRSKETPAPTVCLFGESSPLFLKFELNLLLLLCQFLLLQLRLRFGKESLPLSNLFRFGFCQSLPCSFASRFPSSAAWR